MKLRTSSKRKPTGDLLLFREQTHSTKRPKTTHAQHEQGYNLRSKPVKGQQPKFWLTETQRKNKKSLQAPNGPRPLTPKPGVVSLLRQFRSRRLSAQQKPVTGSAYCSPVRKPRVPAVPARKSLRIGAKCKLVLQQEHRLPTRGGSRRLRVPVVTLSNSDDSRKNKGAECSSVPAKKPAPPLAKVAEDHTQPVTVQHEGPESGEEESQGEATLELGPQGKEQMQEPGSLLPQQQQDTIILNTPDVRGAAEVVPTSQAGASQAQLSASIITVPAAHRETAKDAIATASPPCGPANRGLYRVSLESPAAKVQDSTIGGQGGQEERVSALLNIKAGVQALTDSLQSCCTLPYSLERVTAGVSYVVPSNLALPHVTMRPAYPEAVTGPAVECLVSVLRDQAAIALVMPAHSEGAIKDYLNKPEERTAMAAQNNSPFRLLHPAELKQCLADRTFTCLHYRLSEDCQLVPCTLAALPPVQEVAGLPPQQPIQPTTLLPSNGPAPEEAPNTDRRWTVADSNVQIGLLVRKGIGGTSSARAAARRLYRQGVLGRMSVEREMHLHLAGHRHPLQIHTQQGDQIRSPGSASGPSVGGDSSAAEAMTESANAELDDVLENSADMAQDAAEGQLNAEGLNIPRADQAVSTSSEPRVRLYTQSCRLEMYCAQHTWMALSRDQQAALLGAVQGLERHTSCLFARWNYEALTAYAQKLTASVDLALQQAQMQQAAAPPAVVRPLPAPNAAPAGAAQVGMGPQLHARQPQAALPRLLPRHAPCAAVAMAVPGVQQRTEAQNPALPVPCVLPAAPTTATPAAGSQVSVSARQEQLPGLAAPSTPSAREAKLQVDSPGGRLVMGIPCLQPSPLPAKAQAPPAWPTPAAALAFLHQLLRGAPAHTVTQQLPSMGASGGNAGDSSAVEQGEGSCGKACLPTRHRQQGPHFPGTGESKDLQAALKIGEVPRAQVQPSVAPAVTPQSPSSCSPGSNQAAAPPATPPARPPTAALAAAAAHMAVLNGAPPTAHVPGPPKAASIQPRAAGMCAPGVAASALVLASAASSALTTLGMLSSAGPVPWPLYLIGTRDSFKYHLHAESKQVDFNGRSCLKTEYLFRPDHVPENYNEVVKGQQQSACRPTGPPHACEPVERILLAPAPSKTTQEGAADVLSICAEDRQAEEAQQSPAALAPAVSMEASGANSGAPETASSRPDCPQLPSARLLPAGICTYTNFYTAEELRQMEAGADVVHAKAREGRMPQTCFHETRGRGGGLKRTKFFFGARYLWTAEQAADPASRLAAGVRLDVPPAPTWMQALAEKPLVETGLVPKDFFDAWALNLYHDGSEGIQSHFDDGTRFSRPIFSVRLFSDSRLSFGTQLYGYTNGAFTVDMPRGCITVMEAGGYAVEGVKHCVRPADLAGKSAALIMRHINPGCMEQARALFETQTLQMLRGWSMRDAPTPPVPPSADSRELPASVIERECWSVLDRCIQRLESPLWLPKFGVESQVARVLDTIISKVECQHYLEHLPKESTIPSSYSQAANIGLKRKAPLARMVFSNAKRLKWIEEQLSSSLRTPPCSATGTASVPLPAPIPAAAPAPSPVLQTSQQGNETAPVVTQMLPLPLQPCQANAAAAGGQSSDTEQLLRGLLLAASEEVVGESIRKLAPSEQQRLLHYLRPLLQRLPAAASQLDSFGDAYAPPQMADKPRAGDAAVPLSAGLPSEGPALAAQANTSAAQAAARLKGHPGAVCATCERPVLAGQVVWACSGQCCQFFHHACSAPTGMLRCTQCASDRRVCFHCKASGPLGELVKCSMGRCGHFYHRSCATACPLTKWGASGGAFRCPAHYCARCGLSGDSVAMLQCRRCPVAYHARCRHQQCTVLSKKYIVCPRHSGHQLFADPL